MIGTSISKDDNTSAGASANFILSVKFGFYRKAKRLHIPGVILSAHIISDVQDSGSTLPGETSAAGRFLTSVLERVRRKTETKAEEDEEGLWERRKRMKALQLFCTSASL